MRLRQHLGAVAETDKLRSTDSDALVWNTCRDVVAVLGLPSLSYRVMPMKDVICHLRAVHHGPAWTPLYLVLAPLLEVALGTGCFSSPEQKYRVLSYFLDDVPLPPEMVTAGITVPVEPEIETLAAPRRRLYVTHKPYEEIFHATSSGESDPKNGYTFHRHLKKPKLPLSTNPPSHPTSKFT